MCSKDEALKALQLDGRQLGDEKLVLSVKISDPDTRQTRTDASEESRELFVKHISWKATKEDIENLFNEYGTILSLRMPSKISSKHHDGIAFIDFETSDQARAALVLDNTLLKNRTIQVAMSEPRSKLKHSTTKHAPAASTRPIDNSNGNVGVQSQHTQSTPEHAEIQAKTLGVMNIPDTTNEEQIRKLFEPFGPLRKVILRPDHGGALVEYETSVDAGRATLTLEGHRIGSNNIRIGTYNDLMAEPSAQKKNEKLMAPRAVRRAATRGGRISVPSVRASTASTGTTEKEKTAVSTDRHGQDYFRSLMKEEEGKESDTTEKVCKD